MGLLKSDQCGIETWDHQRARTGLPGSNRTNVGLKHWQQEGFEVGGGLAQIGPMWD